MTHPSVSPDDLLAQAIAASQSNDSDAALALLNEASAAAPAWAVPQFLLGSEYAALGRMDLAEAAFANAVLLAPDMAIARYQLGLLQFSTGRAAMALVTWQPLRDLPDNHPLQRFVSGFAELAQDQFEASLAFFHQGMALNTENAPLNGDVRKVVDEIEKLIAARRAQGDEASRDAAEEAAGGSHVLLSNYRQQGGPLH